ncbi:MAG: hypothetical protein ACPG4X_21525 [Pikeienuella sp.]
MKRENEKRVTLALDGDTYRALRQHGLDTGQSNQAILERALKQHLAVEGVSKDD